VTEGFGKIGWKTLRASPDFFLRGRKQHDGLEGGFYTRDGLEHHGCCPSEAPGTNFDNQIQFQKK